MDDLGTNRDRLVHGAAHDRDLGPTAKRLARDRVAHPAARAVAEKANGIEVFQSWPCCDENPSACEVIAVCQLRLDGVGDVFRLHHAAFADFAVREGTGDWAEHECASLGENRNVRARGWVGPHPLVHRRREEHLAPRASQGREECVVGLAVHCTRQEVHGGRRHDDSVGPFAELHVDLAGVVLGPQVGDGRLSGQARECNGAHKSSGGLGHHDPYLGPAPHELPNELHGLECGNPAAQSNDDALTLKGHARRSLAGAGPFATRLLRHLHLNG